MTATRVVARWLARGLARMEVVGLERLPASGGVLLAVNHTALVDGPLVNGSLPRPLPGASGGLSRHRPAVRQDGPAIPAPAGPCRPRRPIALPAASRASRRTVAEAADRVRTALAAHVAATRPTPIRAPEDQQP